MSHGFTQNTTPSDVLGDLDGIAIADHIRRKEFTPLEALDAAIARAEWTNPQLNFLVSPFYEAARVQAKAAQDGPGKPFFGVPMLVKDMEDIKGVATMSGCRALQGFVAKTQTPLFDALLAAGLAPFGKATTPEFGLTCTTEPMLTGITRNPWSLDHSPGGSSGGSAAAVAAGVVPVASASDGGGSIRVPASCTGTFGFKPSRGRMFTKNKEIDPLGVSVPHCISRSVRDSLAWFLAAQLREGTDLAPLEPISGPGKRRLKIAFTVKDLIGRDPHPDVIKATTEAAALLKSLGHTVIEDFKVPIEGVSSGAAFGIYWDSLSARILAEIEKRKPPAVPISMLLEPLTLGLAARYNALPPGAYEKACESLMVTSQAYDAMFADIDVLLTPVVRKPPVRHGEISPTMPFEENQTRVREYIAYTPLENTAGAPSMSVPLAHNADGLPIGVKLSARRGDEATLFGLAFELEQAAPWKDRKPKIWAGPR